MVPQAQVFAPGALLADTFWEIAEPSGDEDNLEMECWRAGLMELQPTSS